MAQRLPPRTVPKRWFLFWTVAVAPGAGVLVLLFLFGKLALWPAILGGALAAAALAFIIRDYLGDFDAVIAYIGDLARREKPEAPDVRAHSAASDILSAVEALNRSQRQRSGALEMLTEANAIILDSLPDPLLLLDRTRRVRQANRAARALVTMDPVGQDLAAIIRDPTFLAEIDIALETRSDRTTHFALPHPRMQYFLARIIALAKPVENGVSMVVSLHDLTAVKQLEKTRVDFVANVSHELRTPLSSLVGFIETLQGPAKDDAEGQARFLGIMEEQTKRMVRLVEDLLSLSRIELNEHAAPSGLVSIAEVLGMVRDMLSLEAEARGLTLEIDLAPDLPEIPGDRDELTQLFQNLFDNAIKYGRSGTQVRIAAKAEARPIVAGFTGPALAVTVQDEGEGIAPEHIARLTERFYRVDQARSRELGGTGLGLAIVKHIAHRHRGQLAIESALGKGSRFTVYLPLAPETETPETGAPETGKTAS